MIIIHDINVVTKPPTQNSENVSSFKKYFTGISKLCICIVLINIKNMYVNYSHCGPIHFNKIIIISYLYSSFYTIYTLKRALQKSRFV